MKSHKKKKTLNDEYKSFWKKLNQSEKEQLSKTGYNPNDPTDDGVPSAHRYFGGETNNDEHYLEEVISKDNTYGYDINYDSYLKWNAKRQQTNFNVNRKSLFSYDEVLDIVNRILFVMDDCNDSAVKLQATCIRIALGVTGQPTMSALAKEHNITRAAVSLRVKTIQRNFGTSPSIYMKSDYACNKLSKSSKNKCRKK